MIEVFNISKQSFINTYSSHNFVEYTLNIAAK